MNKPEKAQAGIHGYILPTDHILLCTPWLIILLMSNILLNALTKIVYYRSSSLHFPMKEHTKLRFVVEYWRRERGAAIVSEWLDVSPDFINSIY